MPTRNAVVDRALAAHGGEERWKRVQRLDLRWTFRGMMFKLRMREKQLRHVGAQIDVRSPLVMLQGYPEAGATSTFRPDRVEIARTGRPIVVVDAPRARFRSPRTLVWWTEHEMLYFAGYVLWNYAQLPFLLLQPGLTFTDAGTTQRNGETWDKVTVRFPDGFATHSPVQTFYFGPDGLLRRHDYWVGIMGRIARGARLIHAYQDVDGLRLASRIQMKLGAFGETSVPWPSLGFVDLDEATVVDAAQGG